MSTPARHPPENVLACIRLLTTQDKLPAANVVTKGKDYDRSISLWNAAIQHKPELVVFCETKEHVQSAVRAAAACKLSLSVRGGGHGPEGRSLTGEMVLDLTRMNQVTEQGNQLVVGGGALNLDVARQVRAMGRSAATGIVGSVGFTGLATGGGYGHTCGKHGMASDHILGAEMVTSTGDIIQVDAEHHPDLFWAIRGGGCNFGVITSLTIDTFPESDLSYGVLMFPWDQAKKVCEAYNAYQWPDEVTVSPAFFSTPDGPLVLRLNFAHCGDAQKAEEVFEDVKRFGKPIMAQMKRQSMEEVLIETEKRIRWGDHHVTRTFTMDQLHPEAVDIIMAAMEKRTSSLSWIGSHPLHGAGARVPVESTAFGCRTPHFMFGVYTAWSPGDRAVHEEWTNKVMEEIKPYTIPYSYPNYFGTGTKEEVDQAYGPNGPKLREVKRKYDPENVFKALSLPQ